MLDQNQITTIPKEIGNLVKLMELYVFIIFIEKNTMNKKI